MLLHRCAVFITYAMSSLTAACLLSSLLPCVCLHRLTTSTAVSANHFNGTWTTSNSAGCWRHHQRHRAILGANNRIGIIEGSKDYVHIQVIIYVYIHCVTMSETHHNTRGEAGRRLRTNPPEDSAPKSFATLTVGPAKPTLDVTMPEQAMY